MAEAASIIEAFKQFLAERVTLTLTNIYQEVPIVHRASICEVRGEQLVLKTDELQLCAVHCGGGTVIQAPALGAPVAAQLDGIDIGRQIVTLSRFQSTELPSQRRETLRVRFRKPLRITVIAGKGEATPGVIHDISLGGCRVNTGYNCLHDSEIAVDLELDGQSVRIPAHLLRVEGEAPAYLGTVLFRHTRESRQFISMFIQKRELEILKELRTTL